MGEEVTTNCLAFTRHNMTQDATVTLYASDTGVFGGEEVTLLSAVEVFETWFGYGEGGYGEHGYGGFPSDDEIGDALFYAEYDDVFYRYYRVEFSDTSNPDGYIDIGHLAIETRIEFPLYSFGYKIKVVDPSQRQRTDGGQWATAARATFKAVELPFKRTEPDQYWLELDLFLERVRLLFGFYLLLDFRDDAPPFSNRMRWFGRLAKMPSYTQFGPKKGQWVMSFEQSR
jgi:hypothetical protein